MEITLLTGAFAGLQTAFGYRGRVRSLLVCLIQAELLVFQTGKRTKMTTVAAPGLIPARYYLERQTADSRNCPRQLGVLA